MKGIYFFLIIFIFTLQIHSKVHAYQHPLAILWEILNDQVNEYLKREDVLAIKEALVSSIMEIIGEESFGGIYVDVKANKLIVNINNPALENSPLLNPYRDILLFNIVDRSLGELKVQFDQDVGDAKRRNVTNSYIYIDVETNNVILRPNLPPGLNTQPFGPRKHVPMRPRQVRPRVLGGEGIFNRDLRHRGEVVGKTCSLGFFARGKKRNPNNNPPSYIITARGCYIKDSGFRNFLYIINWGANIPIERELKSLGIIEPPNYTIPYDFIIARWTSHSFDILPAIRNTDDPRDSELFITDARPATIIGGHICHSGFKTHVTCGNIKALTAIYLNEDGSSSEGLIITDMNTRNEDIGGTVFFL
ncbi:hypothetical protein F8M41_022449 [Gigaspora margarita]|uniref:Uncharacterized protein n=1 Tax=Gigaspora margarita TaxID=4874 RepID=A0A8H4AF07_GIGMA|nr:hypothetical protein F8M41_022449 [Gigaspora margarita]